MRSFSLGLAACMLLAAGCTMDPLVYRIASNYVPVSDIDNSWEYELSGGGVRSVSVKGEDALLGRDCVRVEVNFESEYWYRDEDQFDVYVKTEYLHNEEFVIEERWARRLVLPLVLGNSWSDEFEKTTIVYGQPVKRRVTSHGRVTAIRDVVLPAGRFEQCYVVKLESVSVTDSPYGDGWVDSLLAEEYYAPDVGLVRSLDLLTGEEAVLVDYFVK